MTTPTRPPYMVPTALLFAGYAAPSITHTLATVLTTILLVEHSGLVAAGMFASASAAGAALSVPTASRFARSGRTGWLMLLAASAAASVAVAVAALAGLPLAVLLVLGPVQRFASSGATYLYRAEIHRADPTPLLLSRMTAVNATTIAVAGAVAGWSSTVLTHAALTWLLAISTVMLWPTATVAWRAAQHASSAAHPLDRDTLSRLVLPVGALLAGWTVVSGFAYLHVAIAADWLGPAWVGPAGAAYALGAWGAPQLLRRRPTWTARRWLTVFATTHLLWAVTGLTPWATLLLLPILGAVAHTSQAACETTMPKLAGPGREAGAFAAGKGALVTAGMWTPPAYAWLLEQLPIVHVAVLTCAVGVAVTRLLTPLDVTLDRPAPAGARTAAPPAPTGARFVAEPTPPPAS